MFSTRKIHRYFLGGYWKLTFSMESMGFNYLSMIYINRVYHFCGCKIRFTFCVILFRDTNRIITSLLTSPHLFRITCGIFGHNWSHIKVPIFWIQLLQVGAWMSDNMLMWFTYLYLCWRRPASLRFRLRFMIGSLINSNIFVVHFRFDIFYSNCCIVRYLITIFVVNIISSQGQLPLSVVRLIRIKMPMMTSSNGNIFLCYWPFVRKSHRWIPPTEASDEELWCFLWSAPE